MTAELLYLDQPLVLGVDGRVPSSVLAEDCGGCLDIPCADDAAFICSFIDLLPCGPMWDRQKDEAKELITANDGVPPGGFLCNSMVTLAILVAQALGFNVRSVLGANLRESSPHTAATTVDDWLLRYDWTDCYRSTCTTEFIANLSPYHCPDECGSLTYVATDFPAEFEAALKHAILQSVFRFSRGVLKNLDGINFVIEPLGARIDPLYSQPVLNFIADPSSCDCTDPNECPPCWRDEIQFQITGTSTTLPGAPSADSFCGERAADVNAEQEYTDCDGVVQLLRPGVIAAECFVRAMLPQYCPNLIIRA